MRAVKIVFHLIMAALVVMAFTGVFSPPKTGNFAQDNGGYILPVIGLCGIWIVGAIIPRVVHSFSKR